MADPIHKTEDEAFDEAFKAEQSARARNKKKKVRRKKKKKVKRKAVDTRTLGDPKAHGRSERLQREFELDPARENLERRSAHQMAWERMYEPGNPAGLPTRVIPGEVSILGQPLLPFETGMTGTLAPSPGLIPGRAGAIEQKAWGNYPRPRARPPHPNAPQYRAPALEVLGRQGQTQPVNLPARGAGAGFVEGGRVDRNLPAEAAGGGFLQGRMPTAQENYERWLDEPAEGLPHGTVTNREMLMMRQGTHPLAMIPATGYGSTTRPDTHERAKAQLSNIAGQAVPDLGDIAQHGAAEGVRKTVKKKKKKKVRRKKK